jgi:hypothetical protein
LSSGCGVSGTLPSSDVRIHCPHQSYDLVLVLVEDVVWNGFPWSVIVLVTCVPSITRSRSSTHSQWQRLVDAVMSKISVSFFLNVNANGFDLPPVR